MPDISVIIPTFNRSEFVHHALNSVLIQTYRNLEVIIVDDGSTDNTEVCIRKIMMREGHIPIRYVKTTRQGVASARNMGVGQSSGRWIAFLDSDDRWVPEKLSRQMEYLQENPDSRIVYTLERWIRSGRRVNPPAVYRKYSGDVFVHCLPVCMIGTSSVLMEKTLLKEAGEFNTEYPVCEDYDLWLRIASLHPVALIEKDLIWKYGGHTDQLSTNYVGIDYWRIKALCGILQKRDLSMPRIRAVHKEITRKADILLRGNKKHGRIRQNDAVISMIRGVWPEY